MVRRRPRQPRTGLARGAARSEGDGRSRGHRPRQSRLPPADGGGRSRKTASPGHARADPGCARPRRADRLAAGTARSSCWRKSGCSSTRDSCRNGRRRPRSCSRARSRRCSRVARADAFLASLYGDEPRTWRDDLEGFDRLRVAVNAFARLRFCNAEGTMELHEKRGPDRAPDGLSALVRARAARARPASPSSAVTGRRSSSSCYPNVLMLDSGCLWGGTLTAVRLAGSPRLSGAGPRVRCGQNRSDSVFRRARELAPVRGRAPAAAPATRCSSATSAALAGHVARTTSTKLVVADVGRRDRSAHPSRSR